MDSLSDLSIIPFLGSEQININNASLNDGSGGNNFAKTGVLKNPTSYQITGGYQSVDSNRIAQDSVGATAWFPQTYNAPSVSSTVSKVFVFGKDQGYEQTADQYGDYRLLILYPVDGGQAGVLNQADPPSRVIPPILARQASWSASNPYSINGASFTDTRITVDISYGDFYYPPFTESSNEVYAYRVSPTGFATRVQAEATLVGGGSPTVYAREWSLKYVTQFFREPSLTQKWIPGTRQGDYYVYQSVQELNSINSKYGTENSSFKYLEADENDMSASNNSERKYTAQFDTDGKKLIGSALPLAGGASENYIPTPIYDDDTGGGSLL